MNPNTTVDEREWQAQEQAMRAGHAAPAGHEDPLVVAYRRVDAAARHAAPPALPAEFALQVAARVRAEARAPLADAGRLEGVLLRILLALIPVALAAVAVVFGARWWQAGMSLLGENALRWVLVAAACGALSWGIERLRAGDAGLGGDGRGVAT